MLIVRDLDRQRFIEAPVDIQIGVLAVMWADEKDRDLILGRKKQDHAVVVAQLEHAEVLHLAPERR